ncbi:MAG: hypothetical protein IKS45_00650 [Thermoguttaceae bacterium]|nr:hypothetical protein [Thermoguttaceae bacterium]
MSDRNQSRTVTDTTLLNYFVKTIGIQIGVVFAVIALLFIVFLSYQAVCSRQEQEQTAPASSEDDAPNDENTTPVDVNVPDTLNSVRSQYSYKDIYLGDAYPDVWYDDYTLWSNAKKRAIAKYGGSEETERAVHLALRWLKSRQSEDGAWTINSDNAKPSLNVNGATGLAALPFLAADGLKWTNGSEWSSEYKDAVEKGLNYLIQHGKTGEDFKGVRYCEPGEPFYNHALATLALGEALVMSKNKAYIEPAQGGLEYILFSQNPDSGAWDDSANPPIYITSMYWNVETLRVYSNFLIYKKASYEKLCKTNQNVPSFLDSVQTATADARLASDFITTKAAQELLLRMNLYRFDAIPGLEPSLERLCKIGPTNDSYYNYIVTQILFNYGGAPWKEWNAAMREKLINAQIQTGTEAGAWDFSKDSTKDAASIQNDERGFPSLPLIDTALSALTLETYYRYKPLYLKREYGNGFPIE